MTPERMKLLAAIKGQKPRSLYALAKLMKKDIKSVSTDTSILSGAGLMELEAYNEGGRKKVRPRVSAHKIQLEFAL